MNEHFISIAHGRVNLIGEHTDYNEGFVLPTLIPQFTKITLRRREDRFVYVESQLKSEIRSGVFQLGEEKRSMNWLDYIKGASKLLLEKNFPLDGFDILIQSSVPEGSGLSSSAALEISLLKAIRQAFNFSLSDIDLALLGQRVENEFIGARIGIMDQMVCSLGKEGEALLIDTQSLQVETIPINFKRVDLVIIDSGVVHSNLTSGYNMRRSECEESCRLLGVQSLRDLTMDDIKLTRKLVKPLSGRVLHVITENNRVLQAVKALRAEDFESLGKLFNASHDSMRDFYEVSTPEIDFLVSLFKSHSEVYGARLTGGGFGGSVVALTKHGEGREIAEKVKKVYDREIKIKSNILVPENKPLTQN